MSDRFTITVTERDIAKAHKNDSYKCVVAQALARTIKTATRIEVDTQTIRFTDDGRRLVYLTPYAVQGYVIAFDAGDPIEAFSFQLRNPIKGVRHKKLTQAGKTVERARHHARRAALKSSASVADAETARAAYEATRSAIGNAPLVEGRGRHTIPRVFKRKARSYGHRLLRINRAAAEEQ